MSSLYHIGRWSSRTEILIQKVDHCGIAFLAAGGFLPIAILLLPYPYGNLLFILTVSVALWASWNITNNRPSIIRLVLCAATIVPFLPLCYQYMNYIEFSCAMLCILFRGIGLVIFVRQTPNPFPKIFGYHEIFHIFDIIAAFCVYTCHWSIIRRMCNPYEHETVLADILKFLHAN